MIRARNFQYKDMTPYMPSAFESYDVQIFPTGNTTTPILSMSDVKVPRSQIITFAVIGDLDDIKILPLIDNIDENVDPDETKIRFYNLDSSPLTFSISLLSGLLSRPLGPSEGTEYIEINPGEHIFQVRSSNPNIPPINMRIRLNPGRIYTLYLTGSVDPSSPGYAQGNIPQVILAVDGNTSLKKCIF